MAKTPYGNFRFQQDSYTEFLTPEGQWVLGPKLPKPLGAFGVAPISDWQVLIAGGALSTTTAKDVRKFDLMNGTGKTIAEYPVHIKNTACARHVLLSGTAVVICVGGECRNGTCESPSNALGYTGVYDINTGIWELTPDWDLPVNCVNPRMRVLDGRLLIMEGTLPTVADAIISVESPIWFQS